MSWRQEGCLASQSWVVDRWPNNWEAVGWFYTLDKACQVQLLADAAAQGRGGEPNRITHEEAVWTRGVAGTHDARWFSGMMHFDLIDEITGKKYLQ